MVTGQSSYFF